MSIGNTIKKWLWTIYRSDKPGKNPYAVSDANWEANQKYLKSEIRYGYKPIKETITVKVKKLHPNAVLPKFGKPGDMGADLVAVDVKYDAEHDYWEYKFGLSFELPSGYGMFLYPRSSNSNVQQILTNSVGCLDQGFRGEVRARFRDIGKGWTGKRHAVGDRIIQAVILPIPVTQYVEVTELADSDRGDGSFGSTGSK